MLYGKRTYSLIAAVIGLTLLSLPVAAQDGSTDAAAGGGVEIELVQTGSANTPVESSGETDSHGIVQIVETPAQDHLVYVDGMGETDQFAGDAVETEYVQTGSLVVAVATSGETDAYGIEHDIVAPVQDRLVYVDGMGETDQFAGDAVETEYVQTGSLVVAVATSGETDAYGIEHDIVAPVQDRLVYVDGMGETDQFAGDAVETEYVQTGSLVVAVATSGETDAYGIEHDIVAPVQDRLVYVDGMGETDQFAGDVVESGLRLAFADIGNGDSDIEVSPSEDRIVLAYAGETDQHAGMETIEVTNSLDAIYVLLRQPEDVPNVA